MLISKQDLRDLKTIYEECLAYKCYRNKEENCATCRWGVKRKEESVYICIGIIINDIVSDIENQIKENLFKEYMEDREYDTL